MKGIFAAIHMQSIDNEYTIWYSNPGDRQTRRVLDACNAGFVWECANCTSFLPKVSDMELCTGRKTPVLRYHNSARYCQNQTDDPYRGAPASSTTKGQIGLARTVPNMGQVSWQTRQAPIELGSPHSLCVSPKQSKRQFPSFMSCLQSLEIFPDVSNPRGGEGLCRYEMGKRSASGTRNVNIARSPSRLHDSGRSSALVRVSGKPGMKVILVWLNLLLLPIPLAWCQTKQTTLASWYSSTEACTYWERKRVHDCPTASGKSLYWLEAHHPYFAASWDYPLGTYVKVCHYPSQLSWAGASCVRVEIVDRGPAKRLTEQGHRIDLSKAAFKAICGNLTQGTCAVTVKEVP